MYRVLFVSVSAENVGKIIIIFPLTPAVLAPGVPENFKSYVRTGARQKSFSPLSSDVVINSPAKLMVSRRHQTFSAVKNYEVGQPS